VIAARSQDQQLVRAASIFGQEQINKALSGGGANRQSLTSLRIIVNTDQDTLRLYVAPDTLLAALWLQCARVMTENIIFRACGHCGKWFEVSPDAKRKQSKYCQDRCKVAAHRARKAALAAAIDPWK
jgi:hypothetical protein